MALVAVLVLLGGTAEAGRGRQRPVHYHGHARMTVELYPSGLYVGAGLVGVRLLDQSGSSGDLVDHGGGMNLFGGLRLGQRLALELGWLSTVHEPGDADGDFGPDTDYLVLNGFSADARIYLGGDPGAIEPYAQGGVGLYLLDSAAFGAQAVGSGFQGGGGVDFHLSRHVDVGLRVLYRGIAMGPPRDRVSQDDTYLSALTGEGTLTFRF